MFRVLFVSLFAAVSCHSENPPVCEQLQSVYEVMCPSNTPGRNTVLKQGPPGKRGPIGQKGENGAKGATGPALEVGNVTAMISQMIQEGRRICIHVISI